MPMTNRSASNEVQFWMKPMPSITKPQASVIEERKIRGPILRVRRVAGGCKAVYEMKKMRETRLCRKSQRET